MALSLNGIEPVRIKGRDCIPKIDAETKLRLAEIKNYDSASDLVLASAFPDDEAYVREFLETAPVIEKEILHAYLVGGESAVASIMDGFNESMKDTMKKAMEARK